MGARSSGSNDPDGNRFGHRWDAICLAGGGAIRTRALPRSCERADRVLHFGAALEDGRPAVATAIKSQCEG